MKRFKISFAEREKKGRWNKISDEYYDSEQEARKRFKDAIVASFHSVNDLWVELTDTEKTANFEEGGKIGEFIYITE